MNRSPAKRRLLGGLCLVACLLLAAVLARSDPSGGNTPLWERLSFQFDAGDGSRPVWICGVDGGDGLCVVTLPACVTPDRVRVALDGDGPLYLDGTPLQDGMTCDAFPLNESLALRGDGPDGRLMFVASGNVATMFLDTATGDMTAVHADKTHKESASVALFDADGTPLYRSFKADWLRGHGQSSWKKDKKSYNLYLDSAADLLGMGEAKKWVLTANSRDASHLRNWMVYTFADRTAGYDGFAPDCAFVDLYLNGQYNGLYLLCEKIEILPGKLDLDAGSWLFSVDLASRMDTMKNPVDLGGGLAVEIKTPSRCTAAQRALLRNRLLDFQAALLSEDGVSPATGAAWSDFIDLDSFARKYLIEEIFENYDAGAASQYYFWNSADGRIYAGPCWDYDLMLDLWPLQVPNNFLARREWKSGDLYTPWFAALWRQEAFSRRVVELYRDEFLPAVQALAEVDVPRQAAVIRPAVEADAIRWKNLERTIAEGGDPVGPMVRFLEARVAFLSSAWIDGADYRTVTFDLDGQTDYLLYCLPTGATCEGLPTPGELGLDGVTTWLTADGVPFDTASTLDEDITLYGYNAWEASQVREVSQTTEASQESGTSPDHG